MNKSALFVVLENFVQTYSVSILFDLQSFVVVRVNDQLYGIIPKTVGKTSHQNNIQTLNIGNECILYVKFK